MSENEANIVAEDATTTTETTNEETTADTPETTTADAPEAQAASDTDTSTESQTAPPAEESTEEISYHAVEKDGQVTALWEMQGRKHLRTIDPRSRQGQEILRLYTSDHPEELVDNG
ncbi:MAG: hypothetical protein MSG64_05905 [Pyrinomonadaceae bacterium MAG19_C2-C3]|nr:hypothetical protein [Pyrinomonadaceae bacterium MAG19_C2-C3]